MHILSADIARAVIDDEIAAARYPGHSPARWALPLVAALDAGARSWQLVALDPDEFAGLWLPAHSGEACHGDTMWLGGAEHGATLAAAGDWLVGHADAYAAANPSCWGRIETARLGGPSRLVVSPRSVGDRVKADTAPLVIVDGLHRALGAWRRGDRTCEAYMPA